MLRLLSLRYRLVTGSALLRVRAGPGSDRMPRGHPNKGGDGVRTVLLDWADHPPAPSAVHGDPARVAPPRDPRPDRPSVP
ncbi:hypothetical protein JCM9533A_63540 [Catenuloplanes niger JCM 9533]